MLLPEEAVLLMRKKLAKLVKYEDLSKEPLPKEAVDLNDKFRKDLLDEERKVFKEIRKKQLEHMKHKIVQAKRKKGDLRSDQEILEEELNKSSLINEDNMIWPIFCQHVHGIKGTAIDVSEETILKQTTLTKYAVYEDFWEKGYYVTPGNKFGGNFLIYLGDPILYHALYIIRCIEDLNKPLHPSEIVSFGRLGTSVKKRAILAGLNSDNRISYITLNWINA